MALYSTWDWDRNAWRVYRTSETVSVGDDPKPPRPTAHSALGVDPDTAVRPLPSGAVFVGYDHVARGEVRRAGGSALGETAETVFGNPVLWIVGAAVVIGISSQVRKNRRRR